MNSAGDWININYAVADAFPVLFGVMRGDAPPPYPADRQRRATV
jgi:hypothetical protein